MGFAVALPYLPFGRWFGFVRLPFDAIALILAITALYAGATELQKKWFYRRAR